MLKPNTLLNVSSRMSRLSCSDSLQFDYQAAIANTMGNDYIYQELKTKISEVKEDEIYIPFQG
jgi:hypothetical protein